MNIRTGLTFDDVMLVPKYSEVPSRDPEFVDLSTTLGHLKFKIPVVSANMKNVTGPEMATKIAEAGGLALLHRFVEQPYNDNIWNMFQRATNRRTLLKNNIGVSVGVKKEDYKLVDSLLGWIDIFCVDVAHGDHKLCAEMTSYIAENACRDSTLIIAGNVATKAGALRLYNAGANVIKVGVGGGSLCTTRIETGNGVPQLTALEDVYLASLNEDGSRKFHIIADGGIRRGGDITKALCFSDAVMLGNLLAGTDEAPGNIVQINGRSYKEYAGSSTHKTSHIEGVSALVPCKGPVETVLINVLQGARSGLSYQGSVNLTELKDNPEFILVSNAGLIESHPHDIISPR